VGIAHASNVIGLWLGGQFGPLWPGYVVQKPEQGGLRIDEVNSLIHERRVVSVVASTDQRVVARESALQRLAVLPMVHWHRNLNDTGTRSNTISQLGELYSMARMGKGQYAQPNISKIRIVLAHTVK